MNLLGAAIAHHLVLVAVVVAVAVCLVAYAVRADDDRAPFGDWRHP